MSYEVNDCNNGHIVVKRDFLGITSSVLFCCTRVLIP